MCENNHQRSSGPKTNKKKNMKTLTKGNENEISKKNKRKFKKKVVFPRKMINKIFRKRDVLLNKDIPNRY